nr:hypothetical protein [uncultured Hyphomonas sp.]
MNFFSDPLLGVVGLVVAHPGHEVLLHGWLETDRPVIAALSDGSGGAGEDRTDFSRSVIAQTGARACANFGAAPDASWYSALLNKDADFFLTEQHRLIAEFQQANVSWLVCDPVEFYNPMHDLANAMTQGISVQLGCDPVRVLTYNLMDRQDPALAARTISLTPDMLARKEAAVRTYTALGNEADDMKDALRAPDEVLFSAPRFNWPETLEAVPFYEEFGEQKLRERRYDRLITYREHVRPMALRLLEPT